MEEYKGNKISTYYQSFSGTDTLVFILLPGCHPAFIGSLTTISYSMYRNKKPVINIGRTNINGVTRGSRIYAGTMIFTLINQHWLRELQYEEGIDWLNDYHDMKVDELPLFDLMVVSANEYGNAVQMYIWGVDMTDEAQVISVEDLFTENTFSFIARDITEFNKINAFTGQSAFSSNIAAPKENSLRIYHGDYPDLSDEELRTMRQYNIDVIHNNKRTFDKSSLMHALYPSGSRLQTGTDVYNLQEALKVRGYDVKLNSIYDDDTVNAVKQFQSDNGWSKIDGVVDNRLYQAILENTGVSSVRTAVVINRHGAMVYATRSKTGNIVDTIPFDEVIEIMDILPSTDDTNDMFYKTAGGYVDVNDMLSSYHTGSNIMFPETKFGDDNQYVKMVQDILSNYYHIEFPSYGSFDDITTEYVKKFQDECRLNKTGKVDYQTWLCLMEADGRSSSSAITTENFSLKANKPPGVYQKTGTTSEFIQNFYADIKCNNDINTKITAIVTYANGKTKEFNDYKNISDETRISLQTLQKAFIYDIENGGQPTKVEYIIYAYGQMPYKWTFNM